MNISLITILETEQMIYAPAIWRLCLLPIFFYSLIIT